MDTWVGFELHPEYPKEGIELASRFTLDQISAMYQRLRIAGAEYGIEFGEVKKTSNSHLALAAGEFAQEHGTFEDYHEEVFKAFFTQGLDIGDIEVVLGIADSVGLYSDELRKALNSNAYDHILNQNRSEAEDLGITAAPTFLFDDGSRIVGAQPIENFRRILSDSNMI